MVFLLCRYIYKSPQGPLKCGNTVLEFCQIVHRVKTIGALVFDTAALTSLWLEE